MKKVGFRVDGNAKIGMGHVMRTLALAGVFPADLELIFIVKEEAAVVKKEGIPAGVKNNYPAS